MLAPKQADGSRVASNGRVHWSVFLSVFNRETVLDSEEVRFPEVWALPVSERRRVLRPWFTVMMEWSACYRALSAQRIADLDDERFEEFFERNMVCM